MIDASPRLERREQYVGRDGRATHEVVADCVGQRTPQGSRPSPDCALGDPFGSDRRLRIGKLDDIPHHPSVWCDVLCTMTVSSITSAASLKPASTSPTCQLSGASRKGSRPASTSFQSSSVHCRF